MGSLTSGLQLLQSAVRYALASSELVTAPALPRPTPCVGWDVAGLLDHVGESVGVLRDAITAGCADPGPLSCDNSVWLDPVGGLQRQATRLLATCTAAGSAQQVVAIGDCELATSMVAIAGALEVTVHGWDISAACGSSRPIPVELAGILLPLAPLLITPASRRGLFADPVPVPVDASLGDQLVAFLGRRPSLPAAARTGSAPKMTRGH